MLSKEEYIKQEFAKPYISNAVKDMLDNLQKGKRVIFTKFGDGEGRCMMENTGWICNCDGDRHTSELAENLRKSFVTLCDMSDNDNVYIGKWHDAQEHFITYYLGLLYDHLTKTNKSLKSIPFVDYHYCYNICGFNETRVMYDFVKTLQNVKNFKIIISNGMNRNLSVIFKSNIFIEIPSNSWYASGLYQQLFDVVDKLLGDHSDALVLMAGGLASKVLITNLAIKHNKASFVDIGSGFDILAQNRCTRGERPEYTNLYPYQIEYYRDLLPVDYKPYFDR
jgi:hypothetical protein